MSSPVTLDRYQLLGELGQGSFGVVYLAYDPKLEREVAVKLVKPEIANDEDTKLRFRREWKAIGRMRHPNIIELLDYSDGEWMYLVTERLRGKTLLQLMQERQEPLPLVLAAALVHEVALALEHAHEQGIVHRDVKPENIFLEPNGRVVLCDFGIAFAVRSEDTTMRGRNTQLLGSPLYMSPEQIASDGNVGPQSDLFSLGAVAFFLAVNSEAFLDSGVLGVLKRIQVGEHHPWPATIANSPFARAVDRLLQPQRDQRTSSAEQAATEFLGLVRDAGQGDPRRLLKQQLASLAEVQTAPTTVRGLDAVEGESKTYITKLSALDPKTQIGPVTSTVTIATPSTVTSVVAGLSATNVATGAMRATAEKRRGNLATAAVVAVVLLIASAVGAWQVFANKPKPVRPVVSEPAPVLPPPGLPPELPQPTLTERPPALKEEPPPADPLPSVPQVKKVAKKEEPAPIARAKGKLRVIVQPWGAVFVDGVKKGELPVLELELAEGSHTVRVVNPDYVPQTRTVVVTANEMAKVKFNLESQ